MDLSKYLTSQDVQDKRLAICQECDRYIESTKMCSECRCYVPWKIQVAPITCPLHKWMQETIHVDVEQT